MALEEAVLRGVSRFRDPGRGIYKRLILEGEKLIGAVMYGDTADGSWRGCHAVERARPFGRAECVHRERPHQAPAVPKRPKYSRDDQPKQ